MTSIALTFDDGPWPGGTDRLLKLLGEHGVHATFFVLGPQAQEHPDLIHAAIAAGHSVQPHCWRHASHHRISPDEIASDIDAVLACLQDLSVPTPRLWRPPHGHVRDESREIARERGLKLVGWHVDPHDYAGRSAADMFDQVSALIRDRRADTTAILLHDCPLEPIQWASRRDVNQTIDLVRRLVDHDGYEFVLPVEAVPDSLQSPAG